MSNSKLSSRNTLRFGLFASSIILLAAGFVAALWPLLLGAAHTQSAHLTQTGKTQQGREAWLDFKLARILDNHNQTAAFELAKMQLAAGDTEAAFRNLDAAGEGMEVARLRLRTLLELNRNGDALVPAVHLASSTEPNDQLLAGLTLILDQAQNPFTSRISSSEVLSRLQRAKASHLALGLELAAIGLPDSSERLLVKQPISLVRNLILGEINLQRGTKASLGAAKDYYSVALGLDPANWEVRRKAITTLRALGLEDEANKNTVLLQRLEAGKP